MLSFVDTAGAYPGIDAEARGQSEAIAVAIETCLDIRVPLVATIIGEGGSGVKHGSRCAATIGEGPGVRLGGGSPLVAE